MVYFKALLPILFWGALGWSELPFSPPEVEKPRVISTGEVGSVPRLPWRWMTWNLQWFPGHLPQSLWMAKETHIQTVALYLQKLWPQVAILQEISDPVALKKGTPLYPWRVVTDFQRAGDENETLPPQNVALVSQWPWKDAWEVDFHRLPLTPDRPVRGFIGARFQDDQGRSIAVYGIHLKSNRGGREAAAKRRERAMGYLRWDWRRKGFNPVRDHILVGGDFNCSVRNPEYTEGTIRNLIQEGWRVADEYIAWPRGATVKPDPQGRFAAVDFDHFLLSPGLVRVLKGGGQDVRIYSNEEVPSDHYPVELTLTLKR